MSKLGLIQIMPKHGDHLWHVWINRRQEFLREQHKNDVEAAKRGEKEFDYWEHSLYEFKHMIQWLQYGHERIASAFEGRLPKSHKQCSLSAEEAIRENVLKCCIGEVVTGCPILASLRTVIDEFRRNEGKSFYSDFSDEDLYRLMSFTCAWHIYTTATGTPSGHHFSIDTSEGYMLDTSDRMFWERVHRSMAYSEEPRGEYER